MKKKKKQIYNNFNHFIIRFDTHLSTNGMQKISISFNHTHTVMMLKNILL